ncbi:MAG: LPXTG cell wall anchor domain-containing protein [Phycisphaeraceae bacterium]
MTAMLLQSDPATGMTHVELGVLGGLCLVGLALVLLGRRLVKPACVVSGAVLGLGAAWIAAGVWPTLATYWIPLLLTGAVAGGLLAGALFRFWVAFAAAAFLALVVPLATLAWQGAPLPMQNGAANGAANGAGDDAAGDDAAEAGELDNRASALIDEETRRRVEERVDEVGEAAGEFGVAVLESLRELAARQRDAVEAWWKELGEQGRRNVLVGAGVGGVLGLLLGVAVPYTASSVLSSLAGSLLLVFAGRTLAWGLGGEAVSGYVPTEPRTLAAAVGLITVVGIIVQWTLRPKKDDASS